MLATLLFILVWWSIGVITEAYVVYKFGTLRLEDVLVSFLVSLLGPVYLFGVTLIEISNHVDGHKIIWQKRRK